MQYALYIKWAAKFTVLRLRSLVDDWRRNYLSYPSLQSSSLLL